MFLKLRTGGSNAIDPHFCETTPGAVNSQQTVNNPKRQAAGSHTPTTMSHGPEHETWIVTTHGVGGHCRATGASLPFAWPSQYERRALRRRGKCPSKDIPNSAGCGSMVASAPTNHCDVSAERWLVHSANDCGTAVKETVTHAAGMPAKN